MPERPILYYRDPGGAPHWSATPAKDAQGRDFLPVYDDEEPSFAPAPAKPKAAPSDRRILYYRNPMGLPDTSPVPKKDSMGMDYIPVYDGDEPDDGNSVKISLDRVQRSGVRTEKVETRVLVQPVRAVGTVAIDESRQTIVTLRADGFIEELFVDTTGQHRAGRRAAVSRLQPADPAGADRSPGRGPAADVAARRRRPGRRGRHAAPAQSRGAGKPHPRGARERRQPAHHRLAGAGDRHRDRRRR